jgi:hypothetical protein
VKQPGQLGAHAHLTSCCGRSAWLRPKGKKYGVTGFRNSGGSADDPRSLPQILYGPTKAPAFAIPPVIAVTRPSARNPHPPVVASPNRSTIFARIWSRAWR